MMVKEKLVEYKANEPKMGQVSEQAFIQFSKFIRDIDKG